MDTGKLLKVIYDVEADEAQYKFQESFQSILNYYNQNTPDALNEERESIRERLQASRLNDYVLTDFNVLQSIGVDEYFGLRSWGSLETILNSPAHEVKSKLENYVQKREDALNDLKSVRDSLEKLSIEPRVLVDNEYEVGFSFPSEYQNLEQTHKVLSDIRLFLVSLADATGEEKNFRINSVSNGTIEVFIAASVEIATHFDTALDYALRIYAAFKASQDLKKGYENFSTKRKEKIESEAKAEAEEKQNQLIEEFVETLKLKEDEKKTSVRQQFKRMLKHIQAGVAAEVRTPTIEAPREPREDDDSETKRQLKEQKKMYEAKKLIDERNKGIFLLQQNNFYGIQLMLPETESNKGDGSGEGQVDDEN